MNALNQFNKEECSQFADFFSSFSYFFLFKFRFNDFTSIIFEASEYYSRLGSYWRQKSVTRLAGLSSLRRKKRECREQTFPCDAGKSGSDPKSLEINAVFRFVLFCFILYFIIFWCAKEWLLKEKMGKNVETEPEIHNQTRNSWCW